MIGTESEKILSYGTWISNYKQCEVYIVTGRIKEHDCRINWGGSSMVMESDLAVDMLVSGTIERVRVSKIIMDEDLVLTKSVNQNIKYCCGDHGKCNKKW